MLYPLISYIKFLIKSTNAHGVHSPFVFDLITNCLNLKIPKNKSDYNEFIDFKKQLLSNSSIINITDYGAGSKYFKNNKRQISDIAKYAGISNIKAKLLLRIITYFKPVNILEIGTSIGLSTYLLAKDSSRRVITLEGCKKTLQVAKNNLSQYKNIKFELGKFDLTLPKITNNNSFDLIYFDGNHTKKATLNYFNICLKAKHNNSIFIFDDIYLNKPMQEAWQKIVKHPKVSVSIDIYYYGLLFFRKEQPKQHFYLRTNS